MHNKDENVLTFKRKLEKFIKRKFNRKEDLEDFLSFAIYKYLKKNHDNFNHLYVDYMRMRYGRPNSPNFQNLNNIKKPSNLCFDIEHQNNINVFDYLTMKEIFSHIKNSKYEKFFSLYIQDLTHEEIGQVLNLSQSRISQLFNEMCFFLKRKLKTRNFNFLKK